MIRLFRESVNVSASDDSAILPPSRRAEGLGYWGFASIFAIAIAPSLGFVVYHFGWFTMCGEMVALNLLMAFIAWRLPELPRHQGAEPAGDARVLVGEALELHRVLDVALLLGREGERRPVVAGLAGVVEVVVGVGEVPDRAVAGVGLGEHGGATVAAVTRGQADQPARAVETDGGDGALVQVVDDDARSPADDRRARLRVRGPRPGAEQGGAEDGGQDSGEFAEHVPPEVGSPHDINR